MNEINLVYCIYILSEQSIKIMYLVNDRLFNHQKENVIYVNKQFRKLTNIDYDFS